MRIAIASGRGGTGKTTVATNLAVLLVSNGRRVIYADCDDEVRLYCAREKIPLLLELPDDRRIAEAYSRGQVAVKAMPELLDRFTELWKNLSERLNPGTNKT